MKVPKEMLENSREMMSLYDAFEIIGKTLEIYLEKSRLDEDQEEKIASAYETVYLAVYPLLNLTDDE